MNSTLKHILSSVAVFSALFVGAWVTVDFGESIIQSGLPTAQAVIDCHSCINHDGGGGGGGWLDFGSGFTGGGGGDGGGGGGYTPPSNPPVCTLDLTKNKIEWTTQKATSVTIVPLTNSPAVPGASATSNPAPGTVVVNMDFGALKAQYANELQADIQAHGIPSASFVPGSSSYIDGFYATKVTADRICNVIAPGTVNGIYGSDDYSSPKNNTVLIWNGSAWNQHNAKNYNSHFRNNFTCVVPGSGQSPYDLSGSKNFVPPLGVGTHTYKLTATGSGGTKTCQATVVVPPPNTPTCTLTANKSTIDPGETVKLSWTSAHATSGSINQGVGTITPVGSGFKNVNPSSTKTYTATFTGPNGTATCSAKVTVTPPSAPGCIQVLKETFDPNGNQITPVAQFAFKLDGGQTVYSDANGNARFDNVTLGTHTVTEVNPGSSWTLLSVTPANGTVVVSAGPTCAAVVFKNQQVISPPGSPTCTLSASPDSVYSGNPSTLTWTTTNGTSFEIDQGVGVVTPTAGGSVDTADLTTTTTFTGTVTGPGGTATCTATVGVLPNPPGAPVCTLTSNPSTIDSGEHTTLTWTTSNAVSFVISQGIGSVTPTSGGSIDSQNLTADTTFTGTATNAIGDTVTCSTTVTVNPPGTTPQCTLSVSASNISPGESISVSWTSANVTSGSINNNVGAATPVSGGTIDDIFPSDDTLYTATFTGPHGDVSCTASVTVTSGGCQGSCGGGLDQPNVSLAKAPGGTVLGASFVSLAQIPYTGFEAGPMLTLAFWLAVALWSVGITYVFLGNGSMRFLASRLLAHAPLSAGTRRFADEDLDSEYADTSRDTYKRSSNQEAAVAHSVTSATVTVPQHDASASALPAIEDVLESRAHAAGVLLSPEAITITRTLKADRAETLRMFGNILNEAVRTIPREDGWILLSAERMRDLVKAVENVETLSAHEAVAAPRTTAPLLDDSAVNRFVSNLLSGDRDSAFTLLSKLEREGASAARFATQVATTLDGLYRSRKSGSTFDDMSLAEKAAFISEQGLGQLVEVFAHALDTTYSSQYTNLKIALAQAFDIRTT